MLEQIGFKPMQSDSAVYVREDVDGEVEIIASIHVDDFLVMARIEATY
jgi:hypothetical protein